VLEDKFPWKTNVIRQRQPSIHSVAGIKLNTFRTEGYYGTFMLLVFK